MRIKRDLYEAVSGCEHTLSFELSADLADEIGRLGITIQVMKAIASRYNHLHGFVVLVDDASDLNVECDIPIQNVVEFIATEDGFHAQVFADDGKILSTELICYEEITR